jgi:hypothetical protein
VSQDNLKLYIEFLAKSGPLTDALKKSGTDVKSWAKNSKHEVESLNQSFDKIKGKLEAIGIGFGAYEILKGSAKLDKAVNQIGVSSGQSRERIAEMREEVDKLGIRTGIGGERVADMFGNMVKLTGTWEGARASLGALNDASKVSLASADTLGRALSAASQSFDLDLEKPKQAAALLDKISALGVGAGGAENVAAIYAQSSMMAKLSGMSSDSLLTLVKMGSSVTKNPEQISYITEQVLKLFTNLRSMSKFKGIKLFDDQGNRKDPLQVLKEISAQYSSLDEKARAKLLFHIAGGGDPRAMRSLQMLLESGAVGKSGDVSKSLIDSAGFVEKHLDDAMNNAVDQAAKLKYLLEEAGESFARPINKVLANGLNQLMKSPEKGGLGLSGMDLIGGTVAAGGLAWVGSQILKRRLTGKGGAAAGGVSKFLEGEGSIGANIAKGKLYEQLGVQSVFVVNMPGGGFGRGSGYDDDLPHLPIPGVGGSLPGGVGKGAWYKYAGSGLSGGIASRVMGVLGPVGMAAATTYMIEGAVSGLTNIVSGGKYQNYAEAIVDLFNGGKIGKAWDAAHGNAHSSGNELQNNFQSKLNNNVAVVVNVDGKNIPVSSVTTKNGRGSFSYAKTPEYTGN